MTLRSAGNDHPRARGYRRAGRSSGMSRREFLRVGGAGLAGATLLGGGALAGCAGGESGVLHVWTREEAAAPLEAAARRFNAGENGVEVRVTAIPSAFLQNQFGVALAAGEAPDLVSLDVVLVPYFASIGAFVDVTRRFAGLDFKDQFNQVVLHQGEWDGARYALPFSADVSALLWDRGRFEEVGLPPDRPPETWDELLETARALTEGDRYGYIYGGGAEGPIQFTFMPYVWGNGGRYVNEDGTRAFLDRPAAVEALRFFVDMTVRERLTPPGVGNYVGPELTDAFASGTAGMYVSGNFDVELFNTSFPDLDFGVALIPKNQGGEHSSFVGGDMLAIPAQSRYPDEAWAFIEFALSEEVQVDALASGGIIPVRRDLADNRFFDEEPKYKVFAEAYNIGQCPYSPHYSEANNPLLSYTQGALIGEIPPERAFREATREINRILQR